MAITAGIQHIYSAPPPNLSDWVAVGPSQTYLRTADTVDGNGNIIDPDADITNSTRQVFGRIATDARFLGVRMRYDVSPPANSPLIKVFAGTDLPGAAPGSWQILKNRLNDKSVVINTDPSDILEGASSLYATTADPEAHYFDVQGCNKFLIGVEVAVANQVFGMLEVKFI